MKPHLFRLLPVLICCSTLFGNQLDQYIRIGLENNLSIRQEQTRINSAETSLKEATSKFLPTLSLSSRYTHAHGGRQVSIPAGQIMLEGLQSLGMLTPQQLAGMPTPDPMTITIMPEQEQETKLQLTQPIFVPALFANQRLNKHLVHAASFALERAASELIRDIRLAYYTCLQAQEGKTVYAAARDRAQQQLTTAEKLFNAGMQTGTAVTGAKANLATRETAYLKSCADFTNACKALNVLLNQPIGTELSLKSPDSSIITKALSTEECDAAKYNNEAQLQRPELKQLSAAKDASEALKSVEKSDFVPTLIGALEGGIIGEHFDVTDETRFYTASLLLQWNLFSGLGKMHKIRKAQQAIELVEQQISEAKNNIRLQIEKTLSDIIIAKRNYLDSELQFTAAEENYAAVFKRFEQGSATSIEMTEAGELLTQAEANSTISRYALLKQRAQLLYATAADNNLIASLTEKRSTP